MITQPNVKVVRFKDVVQFSPSVKLDNGMECPFIEMEHINPDKRYVLGTEYKKYTSSGGAKFKNNDVIFARITPCLENRKIAQVKLADDKCGGFGSTELFVFRAKPELLDQSFLYYLATSHFFVESAVNSMVGASGRQRADRKFIENLEIALPDLSIQQQIAQILTAYDDLIETNNQRIATLEQLAQQIYKEWFVRLRFPNWENTPLHHGIPEGWEVKSLEEILILEYGKSLIDEARIPENIPVYGSSGIIGFHNKPLVNAPGIIVGRKGNVGAIHFVDKPFFPIDTVFYVVPKFNNWFYLFFMLKNQNFINSDAAVPGLNRNQAYSTKLFLPPLTLITRFDDLMIPLFDQIKVLQEEIEILTQTRNLLLPRLISGKLSVKQSYGE